MQKKIVDLLFPKPLDPEIEKKIDLDNLQFVRMMSACVMFLESLMLLRYGLFGSRASPLYTIRLWCFISYFTLSATCFIVIKYVVQNVTSHRLLMIVGLNYCAAAIVWGMVVSAIDYLNGHQMLVFVTNVVCVAGLAFIKPSVSIPFFTALFAVFFGVLVFFCHADPSFPTNYAILLVMVIITSITRYHTKLSDTTARVEHERLNAQLRHLSLYDELTQVKNRRSLSADAHGFLHKPLFLMLIDIDNFKDMNDSFGHDYGDRLLKQFSRYLQAHFSTQSVYRYGGDEFIIAESNGDIQALLRQFERLQADIAGFAERDPCCKITVSGGYLLGSPEDVESFKAMINRVDKALYLSKRNGKNQIQCAG